MLLDSSVCLCLVLHQLVEEQQSHESHQAAVHQALELMRTEAASAQSSCLDETKQLLVTKITQETQQLREALALLEKSTQRCVVAGARVRATVGFW